MTTRLALGIEYDGSAFHGSQRQDNAPSVQQALEYALGKVASHEVVVHAAGRTDTGVHADNLVAHFDTHAERSPRSWLLGANSGLPETAAIQWVQPVDPQFHARFSATARVYCYRIRNRWPRPVRQRHDQLWVRKPLNQEQMQQAADLLVGEHDFSSFRASSCQADHATRRIHEIAVNRDGEGISIRVDGNAFLHHMVRNIVGSLIVVGTGERDVDWMVSLLAARDRKLAAPTASAHGLTLVTVRYPRHLNIPGS